MTFNEYQKTALSTSVCTKDMGVFYTVLGLCGESGEVADKLKKIWRDKNKHISEEDADAIKKELGDVLWYIAKLAHDLGFDLESIAQRNISKITARKATGTLHGSGDNREQSGNYGHTTEYKVGDIVKVANGKFMSYEKVCKINRIRDEKDAMFFEISPLDMPNKEYVVWGNDDIFKKVLE